MVGGELLLETVHGVAAALGAGGRPLNDQNAPTGWTLADPEGNEVDVATYVGRD